MKEDNIINDKLEVALQETEEKVRQFLEKSPD